MRVVLAYSAALWVGGVAAEAATDIPLWVYLAVSLLGSGFGGKLILDRRDKKWEARLQDATALVQEQTARQLGTEIAEKQDEIRRRLVDEANEAMARLETRLRDAEKASHEAMLRAAQAEADSAAKDAEVERLKARMTLMRAELERLHDRLLAYEKGEAFGKRRHDDPPRTDP